MQIATSILVVAMAISLVGCALRAKPSAKAAPAAKPVAAAPVPAPAPPPPLSTPQTNIQLPAPQPVTPEALATTQPQEEEPPPAPVPVPKPPAPRRTVQTPRVEAPAPSPPATAEPGRQQVLEIVPPEVQNRLREEANSSRREIASRLAQAQTRRLTSKQRNTIATITSFVKLSEEAERSGDLGKAAELARRALVLAKDLQ